MSTDPLVNVHIVGFPLDLQQVSDAWHDELLREFALVSLADPGSSPVPRRLLELVERTRDTYAHFTAEVEAAQGRLRVGGASVGDFTYRVPASMARACAELDQALDEAEAYCAAGNLLTMEPPAEVTAFRRWILSEFTRQIETDQAPTAWRDYARSEGLAVA